MSYRSALVDKGRRIFVETGARNVLGELAIVPHNGPWYPVRLNPPRSSESRGASQAPRHERNSEVLLDKRLADLRAGNKLEISSRELGSGIWIVVGDPQPLRRRRALIGYVATVQRVETL